MTVYDINSVRNVVNNGFSGFYFLHENHLSGYVVHCYFGGFIRDDNQIPVGGVDFEPVTVSLSIAVGSLAGKSKESGASVLPCLHIT